MNGRYSSSLSRTSAIPSNVRATIFDSLTSIEKDRFLVEMAKIPDENELPRDSFASNVASAANIVS